MTLTSEALLAGASATHLHDLPADLFGAGDDVRQVELRPLSVKDLQLIARAAKEDDSLSAALMIQQALVAPALSLEEVQRLPAGLARHLVEEINRLSGIDLPRNALEEMVQAPLAKACFVLAREFGWTPEEVSGLTIGQILLYLEMG
ncbi:MAG: hypothetical protein AAGA05_13955, partial [Pseudomonadota bacterium]